MRSRSTALVPAVFAALTAALVLGLSSGTPQPSAAAGGLKIPQHVRDLAARGGRARVIVELKLPAPHVPERQLAHGQAIARQRQAIASRAAQVLGKLPPRARRTLHQFVTVPYVALEVTPEGLDALAALDADVVRVYEDKIAHPLLAESVPLIQGDQVWAAGYDGTGTVIAILDTGVDAAHPFFAGKITGEACFSTTTAGMSQSICPSGQNVEIGAGAAVPCTFDGGCIHGTHVAGIAAGHDATGVEPSSGVAKGAQVMPVQVFAEVVDAQSCGGTAPCLGGFDSDIIAGLEYVYSSKLAGTNIVSANLSLGEGDFDAPCDDSPFKPVIDNLRSVGVATVAAAGNSGSPFSLLAPACVSSAVSVGATTKTDEVAWFSQVAPFLSVFAPGESIRSSVPGGGYEVLDGTSMASPHVAGAWGLLRQAVPDATVDAVLSALQSTGLPITDTRYDFVYGPGSGSTIPRVRLKDALDVLIPTDSPVPTVSALSPPRGFVGAGTLSLTVLGGGFTVRSVVQWNGSPRPTTLVDSGTLRAAIPSSDFTALGTAQVRVTTAAPGGGTSSEITFTIGPPPVITVDRTLVAPGDPVTMTLTGSDGGALDQLSLADVSDGTVYASTQVGSGVTDRTWTVTMPSTAASVEFRLVVNGARVSASPTITVDFSANPIPVATSLSPSAVIFGGQSFTLTVNGSRFLPTSVVRWNGVDKPTTFVSAAKLQAPIDASDIATVGTAQITVFSPSPAGGTSSALTLRINLPPVLAVNTTSVVPGGSVTVTLTNGWGGGLDWIALASTTAPDTTYIQYTYVGAGVTTFPWTVTMPTTPGNYEFRYYRDSTFVREATSSTVGILAPTPTVSSISPTSAPAGSGAFTLTVNGASFGANSVVRWNGGNRPTTFISSTVLTAAIPASDLAAAGTPQVTAFTPAPGGGTSAALTFTVVQPPTLTVSATTVTVGTAVTATLTNGLGGSSDYIALAATSAPNSSYIQYVYVGAGVTTRTWTVNMPNTAGTYEFRLLFPNGGTVRAATSPTVTVTPPPNPVPVLNSLSQPRTVVGVPFTLTLNGGGFSAFSIVRWNGADRATMFVSATQLQMAVTAADVASTGTAQVTVVNPAPGGGVTAALPLDILPAPVLSVDRTSATTGSTVTMTLTGGLGGSSDWITLAATSAPNTSYVTWIWVGSGTTTRTWSTAMPATPGTYEFRLLLNNGYFRAATSPTVTVTQAPNPAPVLSSMSQTRAVINVPFNLTLTGSGFVSTSTALWNGNPRPTTYVSSTQLTMAVPAGDLTAFSTAQVGVSTPAPGGGSSGQLPIDIVPAPTLSVDTTTAASGATVTMTLTGGVGGSLDWLAFASTSAPNTSYVSYVFIGTGVTTRTWSATMPATAGTYEFRLFLNNGYTRVATSPAITVTQAPNPAPVVTTLSPPRAMVGVPSTITVTGSGFVSSSVAQWNGVNRPTTYVSATQLTMSIPASDLTAIGTAHIGVSTPAPGGGLSALLPIDIVPAPTLSVDTSAAMTGAAVTVTLNGGLGGSGDWIALAASSAANTGYVSYVFVGSGVTTRTWSATMPATAGTYEFRLFLNNGYTRVATSPAITVAQAPNPAPVLNTLSPPRVMVGMPTTVTLTGSGFVSSSVAQWNGVNRPTTYVSATQLTMSIPASDLTTIGTAQVGVSTPAPGGGSSALLPIDIVPAPTLTVDTTTAARGATVTVTLTGGVGGSLDWLAFAATSAPNTSYVSYVFVGSGVTTRTWTVTMPATAGTYEFRLFLNNGYSRVATSPTITVF